MLRITGSTALGASGTGGRDGKQYATVNDLVIELREMGLDVEVTNSAARVLNEPEARRRFLDFAKDVQIPFAMLQQADIYLFD